MKSKLMITVGVLGLMTLPLSLQASAQAPKPLTVIQFVSEQPANEWLARVFLGAPVQNDLGEKIGDINDLVFDRSGRISTVVLGVGGFLGMGEKNVGVPYSALSFGISTNGARVIIVALSQDTLKTAPNFMAIEKTTMDAVKDKAVELKDQAIKQIDDMKSPPVKK